MDKDLFEYEMKKAGYRTPESRAEALGITISSYYRRVSGACECTKSEIGKVAEILGWEKAYQIFFAKEVS